MSMSSSPQPSPLPSHQARPCHHHHHLNTPPSSPSQVAAIQASESFNKEGLVAAHWAALHDARVLEKGLHPIDGPLPPLPSPSLPPKNPKPILIKDLKLGKIHRGRALNGTLCTDSLKVYSVLNVLEDETGLATKLRICNALPVNYSMLLAQRLYPKGSKIAVLEPYLTEFSDGTIGILVEKPSDIVFLWVPEVADEDLNKLQVPPFADKILNERTGSSDSAKATPVESSLPASSDQSDVQSGSANNQHCVDHVILENGSSENHVDRGVSQILKNVNSEKNGIEAFGSFVPEELPLPLMKPLEPDFERSKDALDGLDVKASLSEGVEKVDELPSVEEQPENEQLAQRQSFKEAESASKLQSTTSADTILDQEKDADGFSTGSSREISPSFISNSDKLSDTIISEEGQFKPEMQPISKVESLSKNKTEDFVTDLECMPHSVKSNRRVTDCPTDEDPLGHLDVKSLRIRGNTLFADENWKAAAEMYTRAIRKAESEPQSRGSGRMDEDEILLCYSNRSEAWLRQREYEKAKVDAEKALLVSPDHVKTLFRLGRAFVGLGKQTEALPHFKAAMKMAPHDKDLQAALQHCTRIPKPKSKSKKKHTVAVP